MENESAIRLVFFIGIFVIMSRLYGDGDDVVTV
jgi:hypothetical protein